MTGIKRDTGRIRSAKFAGTVILSIFAATCLIEYNIKFPFCKEYSFQQTGKRGDLQNVPGAGSKSAIVTDTLKQMDAERKSNLCKKAEAASDVAIGQLFAR